MKWKPALQLRCSCSRLQVRTVQKIPTLLTVLGVETIFLKQQCYTGLPHLLWRSLGSRCTTRTTFTSCLSGYVVTPPSAASSVKNVSFTKSFWNTMAQNVWGKALRGRELQGIMEDFMRILAVACVLTAELRSAVGDEGRLGQAWGKDWGAKSSEGRIRLWIHSFSFKLFTFNVVLSSESHHRTFIYLASVSPDDVFLKSSNAFSVWGKWQDSSERP